MGWQEVASRVLLMAAASSVFSLWMVHQRARGREAQADHQRTLLEFIQQASEALLLVSGQHRILALNHKAEELLGGLPVGGSLCQICCPQGVSGCPLECPLLLLRPQAFFETTLRHQAGHLVAVMASVTQLVSGSQRPPEYLVRLSDYSLQKARQEADQSRRLAQKVLEAQENERRRIARELHDGLGQELYALKLAESLGQPVGDGLGQAMEQLDRLAKHLCPPVLDKMGLEKALQAAFRVFAEVEVVLCSPVPCLETHQQVALYRIAQEAVSNALRHGRPVRVVVSLRGVREGLELKVEDDGSGFCVGSSLGLGMGLASMRERAHTAGGHFQIASSSNHGTTVVVYLPKLEMKDANCFSG